MVSTAKKMPVTRDEPADKSAAALEPWHRFDSLRQQVDHLFEEFTRNPLHLPFGRRVFDVEPFWRRELSLRGVPAVDIAEKEKSFEITAELPGLDERQSGDQGREARKHRREEEGLLPVRTSLWFLRTDLPPTQGHRCREDRCQLRQGRTDGIHAKEPRGDQAGESHPGQNKLSGSPMHWPLPLTARGLPL